MVGEPFPDLAHVFSHRLALESTPKLQRECQAAMTKGQSRFKRVEQARTRPTCQARPLSKCRIGRLGAQTSNG